MDPSKDTPIMSSTTTNSTNIDNYRNLKKLNIKFIVAVLTIIFSFTAIIIAYVCGFGDGKRGGRVLMVGDTVNLSGNGVVVECGGRIVIEVGDNGYFMVDDGLFRKKYSEVLIVNKVIK